MPVSKSESGRAPIDQARLYYEIAGEGEPFLMIHAGVADSRQWDGEFAHFANRYRVIRYDMRGYGKTEPVEGEFSHLQDVTTLLEHLHVNRPLIVMGCSMGGGLAMNLALTEPGRVRALIMVGSGPTGLELDVPALAKFADAEKAFEAGDLDRLAEIETQIWFDVVGRTAAQVNQAMRRRVYEMDRNVLALESKGLGKRTPDIPGSAAGRLSEIHVPVLVIVGVHDTPYIQAAADYMVAKMPSARKVVIEDAAHLPNMDHPDEFQRVVTDFLDELAP